MDKNLAIQPIRYRVKIQIYFQLFLLFLHKKQATMGTILIQSEKPDDLYFLNEMARRMNLKSKIDAPVTKPNISQPEDDIDYEDTPDRIVEKIKQGLQFEKELDAGLHKEETLQDMFDES